ncbi:hypothetical protein NL529_32805, partial [Klebsiella pneumoniae]|nr:hypothetical protein [Klebsiella pneumoniae]
DGLPVAALWNVTGFPLSWHVGQVQAGHRLIPSFLFPFRSDVQPDPVKWSQLNANSLRYLDRHGLPVCLRSNNWGEPFCKLP